MPTALLFGAGGTLGTACHERLVKEGWDVLTATHDKALNLELPKLDAIVWAQGLNFSGSIATPWSSSQQAIPWLKT